MDLTKNIRQVSHCFNGKRIMLPESGGVYAFWWIADKSILMSGNRHIKLKGVKGALMDVEYRDWWPSSAPYPCLYVGKTTNIKKRFSLHLKTGSAKRLHTFCSDNIKVKPVTSSCQLRFGIEHTFREHDKPLDIILSSVGFSYIDSFAENAVAERFFAEDLYVGTLRPWYNIDAER